MESVNALAVAMVVLACLSAAGAEQRAGNPILEQAAADLAEGRLDAARAGFEKAASDGAAAPFERSLAMLGLADTALARNDPAAAIAAWKRLAADATLPSAHRETARRRIAETERRQKGLPDRDPAAYRANLPALPEPATVFCVAPGGGGDADGSEAKPFPTLEAARDAVRALKKANGGKLPKGGVRVTVRGGVYPAHDTFQLAAEDSGAAEAPVVYQARTGETPVFDGGVRIPAWRPIADAALREKLDPAVRGRVVEADLKALGVKDLGDATAIRLRPELYCDGVPQTLARWPNQGFVKTGDVVGKEPKFHYADDRPSSWLDEPDVRLYGYWFWDWFEQFQKVASIDPATRTFTLAPPHSQYGYRKGQRYYAVNLFRELDQPSEWYLDRRTGMVCWLPPDGVEPAKATTTLSVLAKPFVALDGAEHVVLVGLSFQDGRGDGIEVKGGSDCLVAGCTLRRLGGDAIVVAGGLRHGVFGCTMHTLGCGGARVAGGDLKTLSPGGHFVENCTVGDISRTKRTYTPAVHLDGCGNRIAHNLFERIPSSAMRIEGNDQLIELNLIRHVVEESDDQGGLDMWGNPLYRGVVIRWNRWSDIRGGTHCGAAGVRLDDMISGVAVQGNVFERCGERLFGAVQIHGGKENLADGNLFLDCPAGVSFSRWGEQRWLASIQRFLKQAGEPPYSARYPELAHLKAAPDVSFVCRNILVRCKTTLLRDGGVERTALNATNDQPLDLNSLLDERAISGNPLFRRALFEAVPLSEIGPYPHPWRAAAAPGR